MTYSSRIFAKAFMTLSKPMTTCVILLLETVPTLPTVMVPPLPDGLERFQILLSCTLMCEIQCKMIEAKGQGKDALRYVISDFV